MLILNKIQGTPYVQDTRPIVTISVIMKLIEGLVAPEIKKVVNDKNIVAAN